MEATVNTKPRKENDRGEKRKRSVSLMTALSHLTIWYLESTPLNFLKYRITFYFMNQSESIMLPVTKSILINFQPKKPCMFFSKHIELTI